MRFVHSLLLATSIGIIASEATANGARYVCDAKQVSSIDDNGTLPAVTNYYLTIWSNVVVEPPLSQIKLNGEASQRWKTLEKQTPGNEFVAANPVNPGGANAYPAEIFHLRDFAGRQPTFRVYNLAYVITGVCRRTI